MKTITLIIFIFLLSINAYANLINPNFEEGLSNWNSATWEAKNTLGISDDLIFKSGMKSIRFDGDANKSFNTFQDLIIPANAKKMSGQAYIKLYNFQPDWYAGFDVEFLGENNKYLGINSFGRLVNKVGDLDFTEVKSTINIPDSAKIARVELRCQKNIKENDLSKKFKVWFDNTKINFLDSNNNILGNDADINNTQKDNTEIIKELKLLDFDKTIKPGKNIVKNGDFVTLNDWNNVHWTNPVLPAIYSLDSTKQGSCCLIFTGKDNKGAHIYQDIKPIPGISKYRISGQIKGTNFADGWSAGWYVDCLDKDYKWLGQVNTPLIYGDNTSFEWKKLEADIIIPSETAFIRIQFLAKKTNDTNKDFGTLYADEASVLPIYPTNINGKVELNKLYPENTTRGVYFSNEKPNIIAGLVNKNSKDKNITVDIEIKDYSDKVVQKDRANIKIKAGEDISYTLPIKNPEKNGFFAVNATFYDKDTVCANKTSSFIVVSKLDKTDPFFGTTVYDPGDPKIMQRLGAGVLGFYITWGQVEYERGKYDFTKSDKNLNEWEKRGIKPVGFIEFRPNDFQPQWMLNEYIPNWSKLGTNNPLPADDSKYWVDFKNYVRAVGNHYNGKIDTWSFYGELDLLPSQSQEWFMKHYIVAGEILKEINPNFVLGGIGVSGYGMKTAEKLWPQVAHIFDGQFFDPYVWPSAFGPGYNPPGDERGGFVKMLTDTLEHIKKYGKNKIAVDEKGMKITSTLPVDSKYAKDMANVLCRSLILAKSVPECERYLYFQYGYWDEGGMDYGLFKEEGPRPSTIAYHAAARFLFNTDKPNKINIHKDIYAYTFNKKQGGTVCPMWTILEDKVNFSFNTKNKVTVYNMQGNPIIKDQLGKISVELSNSPIFIETKANYKDMANQLKKSKFSLPELKTDIKLENEKNLAIYVYNQTNKDITFTLKVKNISNSTALKNNIVNTVSANNNIKIDIPISNSALSKTGTVSNFKKVSISLITKTGNELNFVKDIKFYTIRKLKGSKEINGDLAKYNGIEPVDMNGPAFIWPSGGDAIANRNWTGKDDLNMKVWQAWDEDYFYFAALVTDDSFYMANTGREIWNGDGFQFMFDSKNNAISPTVTGKNSMSDDDYQFGLALTPKGTETWCWFTDTTNKKLVDGPLADAKTAIKKISDTQTVYEIAIPWKYLTPFNSKTGNAIGFNFDYVDYEKKGDEMKYWMGYSLGISSGKEPYLFPTFILE